MSQAPKRIHEPLRLSPRYFQEAADISPLLRKACLCCGSVLVLDKSVEAALFKAEGPAIDFQEGQEPLFPHSVKAKRGRSSCGSADSWCKNRSLEVQGHLRTNYTAGTSHQGLPRARPMPRPTRSFDHRLRECSSPVIEAMSSWLRSSMRWSFTWWPICRGSSKDLLASSAMKGEPSWGR